MILAVICFILAVVLPLIRVSLGALNLVALGLLFWALTYLL